MNYSFLVKLFNDLDPSQKDKVLEVLRNQKNYQKAV
jgi:hypothetical protein